MMVLPGSSVNPPAVREWFVYPGNDLKEADMVEPVPLSLPSTCSVFIAVFATFVLANLKCACNVVKSIQELYKGCNIICYFFKGFIVHVQSHFDLVVVNLPIGFKNIFMKYSLFTYIFTIFIVCAKICIVFSPRLDVQVKSPAWTCCGLVVALK